MTDQDGLKEETEFWEEFYEQVERDEREQAKRRHPAFDPDDD